MVKAVIFDLGGVLIDWNPEYLYSKIFDDKAEMKEFLSTICTSDWNEEQDGGRTVAEATQHLVEKHPGHEANIRAYYDRWTEMLGGAIQPVVDMLSGIRQKKQVKLYALTNWSAETFPIAKERYEFLQWFDGIVVSGEEKMRKPFPEFYQLLLDRYGLQVGETLFIDDNLRNIEAARKVGIQTIHFTSADKLQAALQQSNIL